MNHRMNGIAGTALIAGLLPLAASAQSQPMQFGVVYECAPPLSAKVFSCTGPGPDAACDVQNYRGGKSTQRGQLQRQQLEIGLQKCHLQTAEEAQAHPPGPDLPSVGAARGTDRPGTPGGVPGAHPTGAGGFKVGDVVRVPLGEGKILQVRGNEYLVHNANGVEIWMSYPAQIRRLGPLTAQDHALGQYDAHDPVQVLVDGKWMDGEVVRQSDNVYTTKIANGNEVLAPATAMRPRAGARVAAAAKPAADAPAPRTGPPKPGAVSCAGKYEGRYASAAGSPGMVTIVFRAGKAAVRSPDMVMANGKLSATSSEQEAECWTLDKHIYLRWLDGSDVQFPIDVNDDGTLDTPYGELRKKGS